MLQCMVGNSLERNKVEGGDQLGGHCQMKGSLGLRVELEED